VTKSRRRLRLLVVGAGKVGRPLAAALRHAGHEVVLCPLRRGLPTRPLDIDALLIATREADFPAVVTHFSTHAVLPHTAVALHVAGSLSSFALDGLRPFLAGVGQMHPLLAFASTTAPPRFAGAHANLEGDEAALRVARRLATSIGLRPRAFPGLDPIAYHAAAGLVANGAAALVAAGQRLLIGAGVPADRTSALLGPLLRSVADNVEALGMPAALTGPVRRGDAVALSRHRATLTRLAPDLEALYVALVRGQISAARTLGDALPAALDEIEAQFR
jgi:predicted short-subunit dehydrogenase-like oxidoreductase (DUF2520 family)